MDVCIKHLAATPIGMTARATVTAVEDQRVSFHVEAWDAKEKIGEGTHVRAIIDEARFKERLAQKSA